MNSILSKYLFFYPIRWIRGENIYTYLKEVGNIEKMNRDEIKEYQWKKIKALISNSYNNIPYYKQLFDNRALSPRDVKKVEDLFLIPPLSKKNIRENLEKLKSPIVKRLDKRTTSGSTGEPLVFYKDRKTTAYMDAVMYHTYSWHGVNIGDRQARFWGMPFQKKQRIEAGLKDFLMNRIRLSAFELNNQTSENFYKKLLSFKPAYFYGYPSLIYQFALFFDDRGIMPENLKLKTIIITGELIVEHQRKKIERVFKAKVVNEYGCSEVGVIGFECKEGNMHQMAHNIFIEVIKGNKHLFDEEGEIYVTELNSNSFPFIRYKIGDRGILLTKECKCGIKSPLIKVMNGRIDDYIVTPDGRKVYDAVLAYTFKEGIDSFKAIQTAIDRLDIYIKKNSEFSDYLEKKYLQLLQDKLGNKIDINFIFVDRIERERSGKLRYFKSEIA